MCIAPSNNMLPSMPRRFLLKKCKWKNAFFIAGSPSPSTSAVRRVTYWLEDVNRGTLLLCAVFGNLNLSLLPDFEPRLRPIKAVTWLILWMIFYNKLVAFYQLRLPRGAWAIKPRMLLWHISELYLPSISCDVVHWLCATAK